MENRLNKLEKLKRYKDWRLKIQLESCVYDSAFMGEMFGLETAIKILNGDLDILKNGKINAEKLLKKL